MEVGELCLELDEGMIGAGDVAGAAGAGADARRGFDHGADHFRMLAHAEVVVGAPDHDIALAFRGVPDRMREPAGNALEIGKHPVAPLVMQAVESIVEKLAVIHRKPKDGTEAELAGMASLFRAITALMSSRNHLFG